MQLSRRESWYTSLFNFTTLYIAALYSYGGGGVSEPRLLYDPSKSVPTFLHPSPYPLASPGFKKA